MSAGAAPYRVDTPNALPPGTRLGEFELLSLLGVGGFGIVYLAMDHALEREVAIKEYMPATLAGRTETLHVSLRSHSDAETFALGLKSFVNEAKLLARFDHPSLLKVHRFWEANGTAYMAMPVLRGRTWKELRAEMAGPPEEAWLRRLLLALLGALETLHREGVYHRDIAPDNIQVEPDGRPVLMDFGAARRVLSDKSQALTAILKPAYAPIEQYGEAGSVKQGPWTDLYALGATVHHMLLGRPPAPATARTLEDEATALTVDNLPGYDPTFLRAVEWMLCPRPSDRPPSVAALRDVLEGRAAPPMARRYDLMPTQPWERTDVLANAPSGGVDVPVGTDAMPLDARAPIAPPASPVPPVTTQWHQPSPKARKPVTEVDLDTGFGDSAMPAAPVSDLHMTADGAAAAPVTRRKPLGLILGAAVAAAVVAAVALWPRAQPAPEVAAPAPAASAASAVAAAVAPPAAAVAASAAPVVATAAPEAASAVAPAVPPAAAAESTVTPVVVAPPKPEPRVEPRPAPVRAEPVRAPRPAAAAPEPAAVPAGPGPACGTRDSVRYHICMGRECASAEFSAHPACKSWKAEAKPE